MNLFIKKLEAQSTHTLTDLGQFTQTIGAPLGQDIGSFMNQVMFAMIALAVVLAVFGVIRGGYVYMTSGDSADKKSKAKGILQAAFGGLLLAVGTVVILSTINPEILKGNFGPTRPLERLNVERIDLSVSLPERIYSSGESVFVTPEGVVYVEGAGRVIGGGSAALDTDGSPGTYRVVEDPEGTIIINGVRYRSVGATHLNNAGRPGNWWGVQTDSRGQPIINTDGTLNPVISWQTNGRNAINGDTTPFVALSKEQLRQAKAVDSSFGLGSKVLLTHNGTTIQAYYADYAGSRANDYSEISPAAAEALGMDYYIGTERSNYIQGDVIISLPEN